MIIFLPIRIFIAITTSSQGTPLCRSSTAWHSELDPEPGTPPGCATVPAPRECRRPLAVAVHRWCASAKHCWSCSRLVLKRMLRVALRYSWRALDPLTNALRYALGCPARSSSHVLLLSLQPTVMLTFDNSARALGSERIQEDKSRKATHLVAASYLKVYIH